MNIYTTLADVYGNYPNPILRNSRAYQSLILGIIIVCLIIGLVNRKKIKDESATVAKKKCAFCGQEYAAYLGECPFDHTKK